MRHEPLPVDGTESSMLFGAESCPAACDGETSLFQFPAEFFLLGPLPPTSMLKVARCARGNARSIHFKPHKAISPIAVPARPSSICPPPIQRPITVTSHKVAAVVTPTVISPRRKIAPPPMKPTPVRMPSGRRIRSFITNELAGLPAIGNRIFTCIMAMEAAKHTKTVVHNPAALPARCGCSRSKHQQ